MISVVITIHLYFENNKETLFYRNVLLQVRTMYGCSSDCCVAPSLICRFQSFEQEGSQKPTSTFIKKNPTKFSASSLLPKVDAYLSKLAKLEPKTEPCMQKLVLNKVIKYENTALNVVIKGIGKITVHMHYHNNFTTRNFIVC